MVALVLGKFGNRLAICKIMDKRDTDRSDDKDCDDPICGSAGGNPLTARNVEGRPKLFACAFSGKMEAKEPSAQYASTGLQMRFKARTPNPTCSRSPKAAQNGRCHELQSACTEPPSSVLAIFVSPAFMRIFASERAKTQPPFAVCSEVELSAPMIAAPHDTFLPTGSTAAANICSKPKSACSEKQ